MGSSPPGSRRSDEGIASWPVPRPAIALTEAAAEAEASPPKLEQLRHSPSAPNGRPPLLFLTGAFHGAWCFERWLPFFAARGYDAWAFSYRGHGKSEGDFRGAGLRDYLADARAAIAAIGTPPVLIGHSMGGFLVQHLICESAFPAAVLAAPVPWRGMSLSVLLRDSLRFPLRLLRCALEGDLAPLVRSRRFARGLFAGLAEAEWTALHERLEGESLRAFRQLGPRGLRPHPEQCRTPTLVLAAERDTSWTPARLADTVRVFRAELQVIPGAAHELMLDAGWSPAADAIAAWLERALPVAPSST